MAPSKALALADLSGVGDVACRTTLDLLDRAYEAGGGSLLLSFSCGKESVACWLAAQGRFRRILPFYLYLVPGLEFVERSLTYYEERFGQRILRLPHPSRFRLMRSAVFQPPERLLGLADWEARLQNRVARLDYAQIESAIRSRFGLESAWVAVGMRARDSLARWANYKRQGPINWRRRSFYPIVEWTVADLDAAFTDNRCPLPADYLHFGRSFDGIDYRFLHKIQREWPGDYAKIKADFPLVDMELARRLQQ